MGLTTEISAAARPEYQERASGEFAKSLGKRRREAGAPVANAFVHVPVGGQKSPLLQLLHTSEAGGGGRGGQLRAKLYLSLLWVAAKEPYNVQRPARAWAALLGLPDYETKGVRRVQEAMRDLGSLGFIDLKENVGFAATACVRSEHGTGESYLPAPDAYNKLSTGADASPEELAAARYFRVPSSLWTDGHIAQLTGPGLAMLLVLLCERRGRDVYVWFSPDRAKERYGLSDTTRSAGLKQLSSLGLISSKVMSVSESGSFIDQYRRRKAHRVTGLD